jgi:ribosomal protein S18 acetylase RimI-like enzyme
MGFLREVYASTREAELAMLPWAWDQKAAFVEMQFDAQHAHYRRHYADMQWLVVSTGGVDIGRLYLKRADDALDVVDISLLTAHRGRSLGSTILRDILSEAAATDRYVSLHVEKFNPALRLYRRLGFVTVEDRGVYDLMRWTPDQPNTAW